MKAHTTCPVDQCNRKRGVDKMMCFRHWALVPRELQRKIWAAWNTGHPNTAYEPLRAEALALVNRTLTPSAALITAQFVAQEIDRQGVIFATVQGRRMMITHDEDGNGLFAWPEGVECAAEIGFGDDDDGAYDLIAAYLNADGRGTPKAPTTSTQQELR